MHSTTSTRRRFAQATAASLACGLLPVPGRAQNSAVVTLDVAYAGSLTSLMEGPLKESAARLGWALQGHAGGSNGLARQIAGGSLRPDVFIGITPSSVQTVLDAKKTLRADPVARTEIVIAYSPKSRFAAGFAASGRHGAPPWWQVLASEGLRFGRPDPVSDPLGRNILFTLQLAALEYRQPELVAKVTGSPDNPAQIFAESTLEERLQSGELDAAAAYRIQPAPFNVPYVRLPASINLGDATLGASYGRARLMLEGKLSRPEPLVYYATAMTDAVHPVQAAQFISWLRAAQAQRILRDAAFDPPGKAEPLRPS